MIYSKNKVAIMQPYLFPYIGYWQLINAVDTFISFDDVNYIKKGWINRNNFLINGESHLLTLSLSKASQNKLINETFISENEQTKKEFLKTIENSYKKAPFFLEVFPLIETIFFSPEKNLAKFILNSLKVINSYLQIKTKILVSSEIPKDLSLRGEQKILDLCSKVGATDYINPIGGVSLYCKETFLARNINLNFLQTDFSKISYEQYNNNFVQGLSIIDVMMFNSVKEIKVFLESFILH